jgi:hypothetical protein
VAFVELLLPEAPLTIKSTAALKLSSLSSKCSASILTIAMVIIGKIVRIENMTIRLRKQLKDLYFILINTIIYYCIDRYVMGVYVKVYNNL